ncbi:hypothetical protein [Motiliproteus sp. SC1-56]|uniref:hypothetical protein n=1 Tax=Motiliproteus sp. SC1-56 TaxID=2799565 RepID=UPI001A8CF682|nr:hypothetical protein [Motiliproteus sp. SC1-56]
MLRPQSEVQAYILALAITNSRRESLRLVREALTALGESLPEEPHQVMPRFYLLLVSALKDWQWRRRWLPFLKPPSDEPSTPPSTALGHLPITCRFAYLLRALTPLNAAQVADIVEAPVSRVQHPAWPASLHTNPDNRSAYRRRLRAIRVELAQLKQAVSPETVRTLKQARNESQAQPLALAHRPLSLWRRALQRQALPTALSLLLLLGIWLLSKLVT